MSSWKMLWLKKKTDTVLHAGGRFWRPMSLVFIQFALQVWRLTQLLLCCLLAQSWQSHKPQAKVEWYWKASNFLRQTMWFRHHSYSGNSLLRTSGSTNQTLNLHGDLFQQILKFSQNGGYLRACLVYRARPISLLHWRLGWMQCERKLSTVAQ